MSVSLRAHVKPFLSHNVHMGRRRSLFP